MLTKTNSRVFACALLIGVLLLGVTATPTLAYLGGFEPADGYVTQRLLNAAQRISSDCTEQAPDANRRKLFDLLHDLNECNDVAGKTSESRAAICTILQRRAESEELPTRKAGSDQAGVAAESQGFWKLDFDVPQL